MTARNNADLCIQFPAQLCKTVLIFLFEDIIFREEDQNPSPQIFKIICLERRVILQHIYAPEAMDKSLFIVQVRSHCFIESPAIALVGF